MKCDFCSSPDVIGMYPAEDFSLLDCFGSYGGFAACEKCHELIDADNRVALLNRSIFTFRDIYGIPLNSFDIEGLKMLHAKFFEHRNGPMEAIG